MNRSRAFDKAVAALLVCVVAWPAWQVWNAQGVVPFLALPLGLAATALFVVFFLNQPLEVLAAVLLWLGAVALLVGGVLDRETGFPGSDSSFGISWAESPALFVVAMLINFAVVLAGILYALRLWRASAA